MDRFLVMLYILFGIVSIVYYSVIKNRGVTFATFFLIFGMFLVALGIARLSLNNVLMSKKLIVLYKIIKFAILFFCICFLIIEACIIYWGSKYEDIKADYVIILGAGVRGTTPSLTLCERLKSGLVCLEKHPEAMAILSGGKGNGEDISEAEAMKRFLIMNGIDEKRIILEEKSRNTRENILYSKNIINNRRGKNVKVILVTSNFHMMRAHLLAVRAGIDVYCCPAKIPLWLAPTYYIREYFAVFKTIFFDRM